MLKLKNLIPQQEFAGPIAPLYTAPADKQGLLKSFLACAPKASGWGTILELYLGGTTYDKRVYYGSVAGGDGVSNISQVMPFIVDPNQTLHACSFIGLETSYADGTVTGDADANLNNAFDGNNNQGASACASKSAATILRVGKDWGSPRLISGFQVRASNDQGFSFTSIRVSAYFQGSNVVVPDQSSNNDWTNISMPRFWQRDQNNLTLGTTAYPVTQAYRHHRVVIESEQVGDMFVAEVHFFEKIYSPVCLCGQGLEQDA